MRPTIPRRTLGLALLLATTLQAKDYPVATTEAFEQAVKAVQPGDSIILAERQWADTKLVFAAKGTQQDPITLRAATPGKAVFTGASQLRIGGEHLVVEGLYFLNPDPAAGDTLEFRKDSKSPSRQCRVTNCAFIQDASADKTKANAKESRWVGLYGETNRLDHCHIQGKTNKGTTVVVWLGNGQQARHLIDHNYFGPREALGKNGGETIRVGDSKTSMERAECLIKENLFERCNGEAECISNKSCGNTYRANTFLAVSGTLTLRHGNDCLVEDNLFLGKGERGTGGIRIIGEDHIVRGNYLQDLTGSDSRSAITFMQGIPGSPANGYFQVQRAHVTANTIVNCQHPLLIGMADGDAKKNGLPPVQSQLQGNRFLGKAQVIEARCDLSGLTWTDNQAWGQSLGIDPRPGIEWKTFQPQPAPTPIDRQTVGPTWTP